MSAPDFSVLEYLGKVGNGVLALVSVVHDGEYYEATYFYTESEGVLTLSEELEQRLGEMEDRPTTDELVSMVGRKVVPFGQIYKRIDDVDFGRWLNHVPEDEGDAPDEGSGDDGPEE